MKGKKLYLIAAIAGIALLFAVTGFAEVPPPPTNQLAGFADISFNDMQESDCRVCHDITADTHHLLYGSAIPQGLCSVANGTCDVSGDPCVEFADCTDLADTACNPGTPGACIGDDSCIQDLDQCNLQGQPCPEGLCDDGVTSCTVDGDCVVPGDTCDATACPSSWTGQYCGQPICYGASAAPDIDADNDGNDDTNYSCLSCHIETTVGGIIEFEVIRNCTECHVQGINQPTVHHANELGDAKNAVCTSCHGDLVDDPLGCAETAQNACSVSGLLCDVDADCPGVETCDPQTCDHAIPTYTPSLVTPAPVTHGEAICDDGVTPCPNGWECGAGTCIQEPTPAGGCNFCHDAGTDNSTGSSLDVIDNYDTHHGAGVYKTRLGGSDEDICFWCHKEGNPHNPGGEDPDSIRWCENCHGFESLHNIQVDSPNAANIGTIVVGGEDAYWGHVGRDNAGDPLNDSDCWGCHGFSTASAPATGPIIPSISSADVTRITAGTNTAVTLTGAAFTNDQYTSDVEVTAADGSSMTLTPESITQGSLTVIIPGSLDIGIYALRVVKADVMSNPAAINIVPAVVITAIDCSDGTLTVTGSGFGDTPPEGTEDYLNVQVSGVPVVVISWTDTEIVADVFSCSGTVTVNALFGSANAEGSDCEVCYADCNSDGTVDLFDLIILINEFGTLNCEAASCQADCDGNGQVDIFDLFVMKLQFLKGNCCLQ